MRTVASRVLLGRLALGLAPRTAPLTTSAC